MGIDPDVRYGALKAAGVLCKVENPDGFGTLMQVCKAGSFRGQRIRFSAQVRTEDVADWSGLWFRVDGEERQGSLAFDNMSRRPLKGTNAWTLHSVVLDVAEEAIGLAYGVLLHGRGRVWIAQAGL
jgi:hypothetical protein